MSESAAAPCLMQAWHLHERELRAWLAHQLPDRSEAEDLLQDVFIKAMGQGKRFCSVENARAWLFEVCRNHLADHLRRARETVEIPEELAAETNETLPVDSLVVCLPRVLAELDQDDRDAITCCDIEGMSQEEFGKKLGLSLPGAKSRIQRARKRLKEKLSIACQVKLDARGQVCCFAPRPAIGRKADTEC